MGAGMLKLPSVLGRCSCDGCRPCFGALALNQSGRSFRLQRSGMDLYVGAKSAGGGSKFLVLEQSS